MVILGATGARLDHTLFNVGLLERFAGRLRLALVSDHEFCRRLGPGEDLAWDLPVGTRVSLLPLAAPARGVALAGVRWPLAGATLRAGGSATLSNVVTRPPVRLGLSAGSVLVSVGLEGTGAEPRP